MTDKLYISLHQNDDQFNETEKASHLKAIARFVYAFKVLLKTSYKKEAVFYSEDIKLDSVRSTADKSEIALIFITGDVEGEIETFNQLKAELGEESVFLLCFQQDIYERLKDDFPVKLFPLFYDKPDGNVLTFLDFFVNGSEPENLLFLKIFDLIDAIHESMTGTWQANSSKETIYLALTDEKLNEERNILKRELKRLGYKVTPEAGKMSKDDFNPQLKEAIGKSKLSIHLIHPNDISDVNNSLSGKQNQYALDKYKTSGDFSRILWIARPENENDWESIEQLKEHSEELEGAEVLQNSIETLRGLLKYKLNNHDASIDHKENGHAAGNFKVYFLYDKIDEKQALELINKLKIKGQDLMKPLLKGDFYQLRNHHIKCLQEADIVVVFVENVNPIWLQMKFLEILKSPGMGRHKKWLSQIIFLNNDQKIDWLEGNYDHVTVLENDVDELAKKIESGRKMLNNGRSI